MTEEKEIYLSPTMRQLIFRHLASYSVINDGRQYTHLYQAIELLRTLVGEQKIKDHYKKDYENLNKTLISFAKRVYYIGNYYDLLRDSDYKNSNVWKESYRNFLNSLSMLPVLHTKIMGFFFYLINLTSLRSSSIPSEYMNQASKDLIDFETEPDQQKRINRFKQMQSQNQEIKKELIEDEHTTD